MTSALLPRVCLVFMALCVLCGMRSVAGAPDQPRLAYDRALLARFATTDSNGVLSVATNQFAIRCNDEATARRVAADLSLRFLGPVGALKGRFLLEKPLGKSSVAASFNKDSPSDAQASDKEQHTLLQAEYDALSTTVLHSIEQHPGVQWAEQQVARAHSKRKVPSDPYYPNQWHLSNVGQNSGTPGIDVNVLGAWTQDILGQGVTIGIVDDGVDTTQPDLQPNYNAALSYDFNDDDSDPSPVASTDNHGTACAGCALARDNNECGVGAAFRAALAGLRLVAEPTTDSQEAAAFTHKLQQIDIYSNSWGPKDDAQRLQGPGTLASDALKTAVQTGRGGKGAVILFAAGNGLPNNDNCNYDGYANSIHTIAVGAVDMDGKQASGTSVGSEPCAAMFVVAPSKGDQYSAGILTTDRSGSAGYVGGTCLSGFGGTSAATGIAAGTMALLLQSNNALTYRDVQHILSVSSKKVDNDNSDWKTNPVGWRHSHIYGFGLIDTAEAIKKAKDWKLKPALVNKTSGSNIVNSFIPDNDGSNGVTAEYAVQDKDNIITEYVEVKVNILHPSRGHLDIRLFKNRGTEFEVESILATPHADTNANYNGWSFKTLRHWGESSRGSYTLQVRDLKSGISGVFTSWELIVHGTEITADNPENPIVDPNAQSLLDWERYGVPILAAVGLVVLIVIIKLMRDHKQKHGKVCC